MWAFRFLWTYQEGTYDGLSSGDPWRKTKKIEIIMVILENIDVGEN